MGKPCVILHRQLCISDKKTVSDMVKVPYRMRFWLVSEYFVKIHGDYAPEVENLHNLTFLDSRSVPFYNEIKI